MHQLVHDIPFQSSVLYFLVTKGSYIYSNNFELIDETFLVHVSTVAGHKEYKDWLIHELGPGQLMGSSVPTIVRIKIQTMKSTVTGEKNYTKYLRILSFLLDQEFFIELFNEINFI